MKLQFKSFMHCERFAFQVDMKELISENVDHCTKLPQFHSDVMTLALRFVNTSNANSRESLRMGRAA